MCGILGIFQQAPDRVDLAQARRALTSMRHRGPDDEGYLLVNSAEGMIQPCGGEDTNRQAGLPDLGRYAGGNFNVVLGHRRLSIIDLTPQGHQPMESANGHYWIVFNGEIYNYLELKAELLNHGHVFQTESDTEVILAAYQQWGAGMLSRFIGMFAFAILDMAKKEAFLARDCFGIKPLYYALNGGRFAFASEIKALLELPMVSRKVNPQKLYEFLRFANTDYGDATMFADVRQLPPAHYLVLTLDGVSPVEPVGYWNIELKRPQDISYKDAVTTAGGLFEESVRLHMRSDVPVGCCLSGGLDSSAIVALMRKIGGAEQELHTFSYIVDHPVLSEEKYVDIVSADNSTVCHKVKPFPDEMVADLDRLVSVQEQPFMSTSIYAQHRVFRLAQEAGIKVILDGQGADEIFAGYYNLLGARITSLLSQGKFTAACRIAQGAPQNMRSHRLKMLLAAFGRLLPSSYTAPFMQLAGQTLWPDYLNRTWFAGQGVTAQQRLCGHGRDSLREELIYSIQKLSLPNLLRFEDRNSMCHSIESRVPFCNPKLVEFAMSLPNDYLISDDGTTKAVFRQSMRGIVPDSVLDREKVGFATPERDWLNSLRPWIEETLNAEATRNMPFLNLELTQRMIRSELNSNGALSGYLWRCLNVFHWARIFGVSWS